MLLRFLSLRLYLFRPTDEVSPSDVVKGVNFLNTYMYFLGQQSWLSVFSPPKRMRRSRTSTVSTPRTLKIVVNQYSWTSEVLDLFFEPSRFEVALLQHLDTACVPRLNIGEQSLSYRISMPMQLNVLKHCILHVNLTTRKLPVLFEPALNSLSRVAVTPELLSKHVTQSRWLCDVTAEGTDDGARRAQLLDGEDESFGVVRMKVAVDPGSSSGLVFVDCPTSRVYHDFWLGS
jgi:hypothetical protein